MTDARHAAEHLGKYLLRFFALGDKVKDRVYVSKGGNLIVHACQPILIYTRLITNPPREVAHLFGAIKENDDCRLACNRCGRVVDKKIEIALRIRRFSI